jgi:carboxymethylenebutenolidase
MADDLQTVHFSSGGDRNHRAVLALPDGPPVAGVVVLHDLTGFREDTNRHCRRFAEAGYAAIAPDLFPSLGCIVRTVLAAVREEGEVFEVIEGARKALMEHAGVAPERLVVTGFCMGGGFALLAGASGGFAVAAPFYGRVPLSERPLKGLCPTIAQFGERDLVFKNDPARLSKHLEALGVPHEVLVHEGAGHSFMNDHPEWWMKLGPYMPMRAAYNAETEQVAWDAMMRFFKTHLPA